MNDPTYDENARSQRLIELLRALSARIRELGEDEALLAAGPELLKLLGDVRSELFQYEVRVTYDSPEVAESRKIVEEAQRQTESLDLEDTEEDDEPWRSQ
jgi:hypothetical protein